MRYLALVCALVSLGAPVDARFRHSGPRLGTEMGSSQFSARGVGIRPQGHPRPHR